MMLPEIDDSYEAFCLFLLIYYLLSADGTHYLAVDAISGWWWPLGGCEGQDTVGGGCFAAGKGEMWRAVGRGGRWAVIMKVT